jgi:FixJ family two-component response regulator
MNGLELQQRLAAAKYQIPIIFITAQNDEESRTRAFQAGAIDFLPKPFREEALLQAVQVALGD